MGRFGLAGQIVALLVGTGVLFALAAVFHVSAELATPVIGSLPGGILALWRAADAVKVEPPK
jgi:hypothetical protein